MKFVKSGLLVLMCSLVGHGFAGTVTVSAKDLSECSLPALSALGEPGSGADWVAVGKTATADKDLAYLNATNGNLVLIDDSGFNFTECGLRVVRSRLRRVGP